MSKKQNAPTDDSDKCTNCGKGKSAHDQYGCCPGNHRPTCPDSGWNGRFPIPDKFPVKR